MKKIIDGKAYDSDTAKVVAAHVVDTSSDKEEWVTEKLLVKRTGEYFLYGCGGSLTRYAVADGMGWKAGERITPCTKEYAMSWAEPYMTKEEYEEEFITEHIKSASDILHVKLTPEMVDKIKELAKKKNVSVTKFISDIVDSL